MKKKRTLTDSLRKQILSGKIKKSQLDGDALTYWKKVSALKKARAAKKKKSPARKKLVIPKGSELERIIKGSAKQKKMSVSAFLKKHKKEVEALAKNGTLYVTREVDYILDDISKATEVQIDGNKYSRTKSKFLLSEFKRQFVNGAKIIPVVNMEYGLTLQGVMKLKFPLPEEYEDLESEQEWRDFMDNDYPEIFYIPES